jgi:hypothetical protein
MTKQIGLKDLVPDTTFTAEQICRTRRAPALTIWSAGMIVATDGAWDRKHVVESVTDLGVCERQYGSPARCWAIVLRGLGHFYADTRFKLAPKSKSIQRELWANHPDQTDPVGRVDNFMLVEPFGTGVPFVKAPAGSKPKKSSPTTTLYAPSASKYVPKLSPEAVLDSFRVKPISPEKQSLKEELQKEVMQGMPIALAEAFLASEDEGTDTSGLPQSEQTEECYHGHDWCDWVTAVCDDCLELYPISATEILTERITDVAANVTKNVIVNPSI